MLGNLTLWVGLALLAIWAGALVVVSVWSIAQYLGV